jgi:hypothetical protein
MYKLLESQNEFEKFVKKNLSPYCYGTVMLVSAMAMFDVGD